MNLGRIHKLYLRIWLFAFVGGVLGFVLAYSAGTNVEGLVGKIGVSLAVVSVGVAFLAFLVFSITAILKLTSRARRGARSDR